MIPYRDTVPLRHVPWVTWTLIFINFGVFLWSKLLDPIALTHVQYLYGLVPARFSNPEWAAWARLPSDDYSAFVTSMFLHGDALHVVLNMWLLWIFGDNVEDRMRPLRFLSFYLLCGLVAGMFQCYVMPDATVPVVGASGAIAGLMGAYYFLFPYARIVLWFLLPIFIEVPAISFLGIWVIIQLYKATSPLVGGEVFENVAWWGHLGGFIAGMVCHHFFLHDEIELPRRRLRSR